jgi:DNA-binding GntR family transcriptional regulator
VTKTAATSQQRTTPSQPQRAGVPARIPTVVEEVVRGVRSMIMSAEFRPGQRLIEEPLAERFGVSRPPIREALRVLQRDGIVTSIPRKGFIVIPITAEDVREIYELRWILERSALEIAVPLTDLHDLDPLAGGIERMNADSAQSDPDEMLAANSEFHEALVDLAGNTRLSAAYSTISTQLQMCMAMNLRFRRQLYGDPREAVRRHQVLFDLIKAGELAPLLAELEDHGDRTFLTRLDELIGPPQ